GIADGTYELRSVTKDVAGNRTTSAVHTVVVDNTAPAGALTQPAAGAPLRAVVTLAASSADGGSGVASAPFQVEGPDDSSFSDLGGALTASPYDHSWDTTAVADGSYDLRVVTTDGAGNTTTSAARTVLVDNTAPTGAITAPAANAAVRGDITVDA